MKTSSLKLPPALDAKLARIARRKGITRSEVLREALAAYDASATGSFADLARDLCGSLRGPRDLASNPEHLDGYGR